MKFVLTYSVEVEAEDYDEAYAIQDQLEGRIGVLPEVLYCGVLADAECTEE